jgi:hypothetical protein
MVKAAAQNGWIDERRITLEILTGIKRAGADLIISYHAREVARWLGELRVASCELRGARGEGRVVERRSGTVG